MAMTPFTEIDKKNALTKDNKSCFTMRFISICFQNIGYQLLVSITYVENIKKL